ncbi:MAG: hypothetical protein OXQ29_04480 [Rhodospirillaceae bacterium]|nr:hypothetical protein [Rhodospirillaceae bacterium]
MPTSERGNRQSTQPGISARIREARMRAGLEPAELRKNLARQGVTLSKTGLHRLETVEPVNPNLKLMLGIADATHVTPEWLLFGKGTPRPDEKIGPAIRARVIDTIAFMAGALDLTEAQEEALDEWLKSVRSTKPETIRKP